MNNYENTLHSFMTSNYSDRKLSKEFELNESMSITSQAQDTYNSKIMSLGGEQFG